MKFFVFHEDVGFQNKGLCNISLSEILQHVIFQQKKYNDMQNKLSERLIKHL